VKRWVLLSVAVVSASLASIRASAQTTNLGQWSDTIQFPNVPAAAAVLPNGKLLTWSSNHAMSFETDIGAAPSQTYTSLYDPATNSVQETVVTSTMADMFCPGSAYLTDGRIMVNGGSSSSHTAIYNPLVDSWGSDAPMNVARGYNSTAALPDGRAFTIGGTWSGDPNVPKIGEIWAQGSGWTKTAISDSNFIVNDPSVPEVESDRHPWLFVAPNSRIFVAGPMSQMDWINTSGQGSITPAGLRGDDNYSVNGVAAMYAPGKILKAGGAPAYSDADATASAYEIDITAGLANPAVNTATVTKLQPMAYPRGYANGVVLPGGGVLVIGGQSHEHQFFDDNSVLVPELWSPVTETFTRLAPMATPRNYHSVALLLPDGRVFSGGGGLCPEGMSPCDNHPDGAIFSPPYLYLADGVTPAPRPALVAFPTTARVGTTITVTTSGPVAAFDLIRLSTTTHTVNTDQRRVPLSFTPGISTYAYDLALPADPGIVVPGYWMLFALDATGVPSVSGIILVQP
jgi:Domain of unknown function (DUF1929)